MNKKEQNINLAKSVIHDYSLSISNDIDLIYNNTCKHDDIDIQYLKKLSNRIQSHLDSINEYLETIEYIEGVNL